MTPNFALEDAIMQADRISRQKGLAPLMENDPKLPLSQQPMMVVHLGAWFGRKPVDMQS